jgi:pimeloyl-ACP methyl ester carboxylesterase
MTQIQQRTVETNGIHMHIAEQGAGPLIVLCHGFPESWYSWRHQLPALYVAGDRDLVVAFRGMDQLIPNLSQFGPHLRKTVMLPGCGHWTQAVYIRPSGRANSHTGFCTPSRPWRVGDDL